uniref:coiled-coil domain-containing protein 146 n=1 Tax=Ciona intestinalis TaxID=7719 RepID=UPI0000522F7B|nr:coiled-coil domain-containing protein 146 [Ciona intestinalis]|eukprot:XP_002121618.1 coiled-coil domain-containing protein 146 [Ciona intestinalis]
MSSSNILDEENDNEDNGSHESRPISAIAPSVRIQEESQVEITASPAFQCLEELFDAGKVTGTRMAELKSKYTAIHDMLKHTRESETKLLEDAKNFTNELEKQRQELEKADHFPENIDTEVGKLRQDLLKRHNDIQQIEEREYELHYKIDSLEEEFRLLKREYERIPKQDEVEAKKREIENQTEQLKKENAQRILELKNLREDLEAKDRQNGLDAKELETKIEEREGLKNNLVQIHGVPTQLSKEIDKINKQKIDVTKRQSELSVQFGNLESEMKMIEGKRVRIEEEKREVEDELDFQRSILEGKEREYDKLMKDFDFEKEREAVLLGDRASLDLSLRHTQLEKKTGHDTLTRKQREKDRDLRQLKKLEQQLKVTSDALSHQQTIYDKVKDQSLLFPKDDGSLYEKRKQLQAEVDEAKRKHGQQNSLTSVEQGKVEDCILEEERLIKQQEELRGVVVDLTRLAQIKADEREQKARDFMRADQRYHRAEQELKSKQLVINDHKKKNIEVQVRLQEFAKLYDVIKNERNKCVNQIQACTQKSAEMKEKIKILANEIEILRTTVTNIERNLQKARLKKMNSLVVRDSLRNERSKALSLEAELIEKREQLKMQIGKLNTLNNQAEEGMVQLRKKYETAVQHRNDRGVQLVEREEEVCIFYEKFNIQETMIRNGDVAVQTMEEEIRFLRMQNAEEQRQINLGRKNRPNLKHLNDELVTLQIQLSQCQDRMKELEKELEDPDRPGRVRLLQGKDPSPTELRSMVENLEIRLAEKEEQLLERDLIFEQDSRLADRVQNKVEVGKNDSLSLAKKVNGFQSRIKDVTRKMMSLVSELAMKQAETMQLQQKCKSMHVDLQQGYTRMEQGEPPSDEIYLEWEKLVSMDMRKRNEDAERAMADQEEQQYQLVGGTATTAEPRPNAYIPEDETELPIPRPYGSLAPFKPTEPGSSMRHIRKPVLRPIEI